MEFGAKSDEQKKAIRTEGKKYAGEQCTGDTLIHEYIGLNDVKLNGLQRNMIRTTLFQRYGHMFLTDYWKFLYYRFCVVNGVAPIEKEADDVSG